jgi:lipopolysaccharide/colanic/teichoic acid biosynthesis glycosyltransferase
MTVAKTVKEQSDTNISNTETLLCAVLRRSGDILISLFTLLVLSPFLLLLVAIIRISGKGPIVYFQDRIGKNGRPFLIYKFRSMIYYYEK